MPALCECFLMYLPRGLSPGRTAGQIGEARNMKNARNARERIGTWGIRLWTDAARVFQQGRRGLALCHCLGAPVSTASFWRREAVSRIQFGAKTSAYTVGEALHMTPVKLRARGVSSGPSLASKQQPYFFKGVVGPLVRVLSEYPVKRGFVTEKRRGP
ncbi:hypothetical protein NDU88_007970 [Pleurodeles waltl]|uniref:Uncharacterized protein n=1 Tax=Pleurodeles waltl TaxID=8319 RepID=A0AAV7RTA5_PLEWA|nr:hypothetical protein NDU88_007970 [Pleurodeles waltl]